MVNLSSSKIVKIFRDYFMMALGMGIYSFGWIGCILPAGGVGGGATGFSVILCQAIESSIGVSIEVGTMFFIINAVLLCIAGFIVGWNFGIKSVFCIVSLSILMNLWKKYIGPDAPVTELKTFFAQLNNVEDVLRVILGGVLAGIGVTISFRYGGSTGGTDIVAMIINKYRNISYGKIVIYSDFAIIASAMFAGMGIDAVIYGYVMTAVFGYTVDQLMSGSQQSSQIMIITPDHEKMAEAITTKFRRGVTLIDGMGWYSKEPTKIVMVVCRKRESMKILKFIKTIDENAFISVASVMGVYGLGFQTLKKV